MSSWGKGAKEIHNLMGIWRAGRCPTQTRGNRGTMCVRWNVHGSIAKKKILEQKGVSTSTQNVMGVGQHHAGFRHYMYNDLGR